MAPPPGEKATPFHHTMKAFPQVKSSRGDIPSNDTPGGPFLARLKGTLPRQPWLARCLSIVPCLRRSSVAALPRDLRSSKVAPWAPARADVGRQQRPQRLLSLTHALLSERS